MTENFWKNKKQPIFALAPMEDVTDTVFREIILNISNKSYLNIVCTEFTSTDGLLNEKGRKKVIERFFVNESEKKILKQKSTKLIAQIWGSDPEKFYKVAKELSTIPHFDGLDINMGCPVKKVIKNNTCSALILQPKLAKEIVQATKEGYKPKPISVKTRIGFNSIETENWIGSLLETTPSAITIHGRTQKQMSKGTVLWDEIEKARKLRDKITPQTAIIGNGDILSYDEGISKAKEHKLDGIMIGRGIFSNPWLFNKKKIKKSKAEKLNVLQKHVHLFKKTWGNEKNLHMLKKYFKIYITDFSEAGNLRSQLMNASSYEEISAIINHSHSCN